MHFGIAHFQWCCQQLSGDYVIAFSTAKNLQIPYETDSKFRDIKVLRNDQMTPLLMPTIESTEAAILNSLFATETMIGRDEHYVESLAISKVLEMFKK